ncbi:hypothetical protein GW17_00027431, partial [Ensete ventricosum]
DLMRLFFMCSRKREMNKKVLKVPSIEQKVDSTLSDFQYIDSSGRDQGNNVRRKSQSLVVLVNDKERVYELRQKGAASRDKDEDRYGNGKEKEWGSKDDDRYNRDRDSYGREGDRSSVYSDERYGRDGSRDDDSRGGGASSSWEDVPELEDEAMPAGERGAASSQRGKTRRRLVPELEDKATPCLPAREQDAVSSPRGKTR